MVCSFGSRTIALEGGLIWPFSFCEETSGQGLCWSILKFANDDEIYIQVLSVSHSLPQKKIEGLWTDSLRNEDHDISVEVLLIERFTVIAKG
jgi:hypothetical protein